ncbi:MAG: SpoIIE family protein phosphatase [Prevotella sp.]|nr:SpoIIE family protein phosphatase [Prevotella sp.]
MKKLFRNFMTYLRKHISSSLGIIISAAVLVELINVVQFYYTRDLLRTEIEQRAQTELMAKADMIAHTLHTAEATMEEHCRHIQQHLQNPDDMFTATKQLIEINPNVVGGCICFVPYYYKEKGRIFEPYAEKRNGQVVVSQIASAEHDYTLNPAFIKALREKRKLWSDPYIYGENNQQLTTYSYPLLDAKGNVAAVCGLDIDLTWLSDTINSMHYYPSSFGLVLTQEGQLAVGPSAERADQNDVKQIMNLVNNRSKRETSGGIEIAEFVGSKNQSEGTVYFTSLKEYPHWQVVLVNYDNEVFEPIKRMRFRNMILILSGLLVLFFIINRFARNEKRLRQVGIKQTRIDSELHIASAIQQTMLPKTFPPYPERNDIDIYGSLVPAKEVGGDLFDFYIRDEKLFFCIGDVSGKGVPSAIVMAVMQKLFRITSAHTSNPAYIVQAINQELCNNNERNMFMTFFIGVLDLPSGRLRFCNAGHETPLILSEDAGCVTLSELPMKSNLPIGVFPDFAFEKEECQLPANSTFFLYTDGLTEALNAQREQFRLSRIKEVLSHCTPDEAKNTERLINVMSDAVNKFTGNTEQSDDLTMLAIRYQRLTEHDMLCDRFVLQNDLRQIRPLNNFIKEFLERFGVEKSLARRLQLAVEEVVTNVVSYAYSPGATGDISVEAFANERRLKFIISDEGVAFDPTSVANADTSLAIEDRPIGGLGILLTRGLVDSVNYERLNGRNVLTLRKNIHADR